MDDGEDDEDEDDSDNSSDLSDESEGMEDDEPDEGDEGSHGDSIIDMLEEQQMEDQVDGADGWTTDTDSAEEEEEMEEEEVNEDELAGFFQPEWRLNPDEQGMDYSEEDIDDAADIAEFREIMGNLHGQIFDDMPKMKKRRRNRTTRMVLTHIITIGFQLEEEVERTHYVMEVDFLSLHYLLEKVCNLEVVSSVMTIVVICLIDQV